MRSQAVTMEPQVVQLGRESVQTVKVVNNTGQPISNFFFCLYNVEKFSFSPDSFSLAPHEHKLITITLRVKSSRAVAKEFAYLKANDINRRLTLLINSFHSPDAKPRPEEGTEDLNTLSSREYRDIQTQAIEKIIKEKEAYIALLEKDGVNRNINFRTEESAEKVRREVEELEVRLRLAESEQLGTLKEKQALETKFEEYRRYCEKDLRGYERVSQELGEKQAEIIKLQGEVSYLEEQGQQFLRKIEQKEQRISELEQQTRKAAEDIRREADKKLASLEERLEEQKRTYGQSSRHAEDRVKELERKIQAGEKAKERAGELEREVRRKEQEVRSLMSAVETERLSLKEVEGEKKKLIKYELMNESMSERNNELSSRLQEFEKLNHNLREEIFVYKTKLAENDLSTDKMNQYLEIALESCRSENDALKRSKQELEKSLDEFMALNRHSHDNNRSIADQLSKYKEEVTLLLEIKDNLERRNEEIKQEHHLALMQLKAENIELLEKVSLAETNRREELLRQTQTELALRLAEVDSLKGEAQEFRSRAEAAERESARLGEKVKRYKKEAKKELKSINETAISQLHKEHDERKRMAQRIIELEDAILNLSCDKAKEDRNKQLSELQDIRNQREKSHSLKRETETRVPEGRDRSSSRVVGIKDQRREINETNKAYSVASQQEQLCSELGELRELNSYIRNQEERFGRLFDFGDEDELEEAEFRSENRPIFRAMQFFKKMENKLREYRGESQILHLKEIQFLKGRILELENREERDGKDGKDGRDGKDGSMLNLSKTREQCSDLLEYVREEMRSQYKKLNDAVKLQEQKYQLLKRKIYEEYRAKIVDILGKKEKGLPQLESTLERFIEGMSNMSHKEALLQREVKLKQNARKQKLELRERVNELSSLLHTRKGCCSRDHPRLPLPHPADTDWQESLKREAEFLSLSAEHQRLKEEAELLGEELAEAREQARRLERAGEERASEVLRLKKYQVELQTNYESEIQKQYSIIEDNKKRILEMTRSGKEASKQRSREQEHTQLKDSLDRQREVIKVLREKEKMLEEILEESHRTEEKERKKTHEETRTLENLRDLKDNNRELRTENAALREKLGKAEEELDKKNAYLRTLKGDAEENRVRAQRKEEAECERLREELRKNQEEGKRSKEEAERGRKKREKELSDLRNDIDRLKNENLITEKSLESVIRALLDTSRKLYARLRRLLKKRGKDTPDHSRAFQTSQGVLINALRIDEVFEEVLAPFEQAD